jgi:hypothetical protein
MAYGWNSGKRQACFVARAGGLPLLGDIPQALRATSDERRLSTLHAVS